jgi:CDP-4-dehydro-6-deoxyglucose reductase
MTTATVIVENTGATYSCGFETILLDAALDAGLSMPHSCRGGACGTCKAKVLEGAVDHGWVMSFAITDEEKAEGYCLCCQSKPRSERVVLRMEQPMHMGGRAVIAPAEFQASVTLAAKVTPSVLKLVVALPAGMRGAFHPGQNIEFHAPGETPRPYSIAHAPAVDETAPDGQLAFYITRHLHGRVSAWLHDSVRPGDTLTLKGPYGEFDIPPGDGPILGLAGGTGLSPVLSLIEAALRADAATPVELLLSVRERREALALDTLAALARRHGNFRYRVTLTREGDAPAPFLSGRVQDVLSWEAPDLARSRIIIAGAPGFVEDVGVACRALGAAAERIAIDSFVTNAPA